VRTADFDYDLPPELIAQTPASERDDSRLLVIQRNTSKIVHRRFRDLAEYLRAGDLLVFNDTKVIPARLFAIKPGSPGRLEIMLVEENGPNDWWALARPARRWREGSALQLIDHDGRPTEMTATLLARNEEGHCRVQFHGGRITEVMNELGEVPLPPYIQRGSGHDRALDRARYQTIFARQAGSVAAPTAGLHFTERTLATLNARGVQYTSVTLQIGLGTFAPVKTETVGEHIMHAETYEISGETAELIAQKHRHGHRVIPVGTSALRTLESVAAENGGRVIAKRGRTQLFIHPPFRFAVADGLLTNFHQPRSTLLMLVSAFAEPGGTRGGALIKTAYAEAIRERYRFLSYGDAMLIV
jgi:S-adenosylmethionine:tRNA ribosyltransferase-isomerase